MKKKIKIAPSILASNFSSLGEEITNISKAGADYIHFDIMDGHFVPNLTFGPNTVKYLRKYSKKTFDVHLMIEPVDKFLIPFIKAGADIISFHPETVKNVNKTIKVILYLILFISFTIILASLSLRFLPARLSIT